MRETVRANLYIDRRTWERFRALCVARDISCSRRVRELMRRELREADQEALASGFNSGKEGTEE